LARGQAACVPRPCFVTGLRRDSPEPGLSLPLRQELPVLRQRNPQPKLDWARTGGCACPRPGPVRMNRPVTPG